MKTNGKLRLAAPLGGVLVAMAGAAWSQVGTVPPVIMTGSTGSVEATIVVNGDGAVRWGSALCAPTSGQTSAVCNRTLAKDQPVVFEATPRPGQAFTAWAGACAGQGPRCQLKPGAKFTVAATFAPKQAAQTVRITVSLPAMGGRVGPAPFASSPINCSYSSSGAKSGTCTADIPVGTTVALVATPEQGAKFKGWSGTPGCTGTQCQFTANSPVNLVATFEPPLTIAPAAVAAVAAGPTYTLTIETPASWAAGVQLSTNPDLKLKCTQPPANAGNSAIWVQTCTAQVAAGTTVSVKGMWGGWAAHPVKSDEWSGDCVSINASMCTVGMSGNRLIRVVTKH